MLDDRGLPVDTSATIVYSKFEPPHVATDADRKERWMYDEWVIDASMSAKDLIAYCPLDGETVVVGLTMIGTVPEGGRVVAIWHPDNEDEAATWQDEMLESEGLPPSEWVE